jgi:hypothetical protein
LQDAGAPKDLVDRLGTGRSQNCPPVSIGVSQKVFAAPRNSASRRNFPPFTAPQNPFKEPHMDNIHTEHGQAEAGPAKAVSQLSESMAHTAESHRALIQELSLFAKDEGLRFVNLRLERNGQALDKLQNCQGIPGLISVQQEWLRDLLQDYVSHNLRLAGALRGFTQNVMACASEHVAENIDRAQHSASDMAQETNQQANHIAQDMNTYAQQTQH